LISTGFFFPQKSLTMKYLSVCSGIEAATVAWHPLGWQPVAFGEIEKFPSLVLEHHYPDTPNWGDMTKFKEWPDADVNVFVGGTPCQSFSVAGLRKGLDDQRGNLMLTYLAIAARYRPQWLVWENVPGVLSSNGGLDFASLLRGMGELGYGFAYRILDAQYFGVAQRRRRVFVVGYLGNWQPAAAVLFERHSLSGHPAPSREKREGAAANAGEGAEVGSLIPAMHSELCPSLKARDAKGPSSDGDGDGAILVPMVQPIALAENTIGRKPENGGNGDGFTEEGPMYTLNATGVHGVAQPIPLDMMNIRGRPSDDGRANRIGRGYGEVGDPMFTITKANHHGVAQPIAFSGQMSVPQTDVDMTQTLQAKNPMAVAQPIGWSEELTASVDMAGTLQYGGQGGRHDGVMTQALAVRRLTPKECERLQGFPDNYTDIKPKGKATPDGPRYKALGNSMAVPVMAWIGKRIQEVDAICQTQKQ
jgi:DNA (cytosine-5)-methyltransferase 1